MAEFGLADLIGEMRAAVAATGDPAAIVERLSGPAHRLATARAWREPRFLVPDTARGFAIFPLHEEPDHTLSVVVASLNPGYTLPPHDHRTWALQVGIDGTETDIRWRRLDDGRRTGYAELAETGRRDFGPGDVVTFVPADIHSVRNDGRTLALSLNLYGLSYGHTGARTFDPVARTEAPLIPVEPPAAG
jgi:predicted metal-dependent enzyme (double-stranded beta helix superfamily)